MKNEEQPLTFKSLFVPFTNKKAVTLMIIIGLIVFSNGLLNGFVGDDQGQIIDNSFVHSIGNIPIFFQSSTFFNGNYHLLIGNYFRPLMLTYFSILYHFFGANPFFFHFAQAFLHLANAILVFLFLSIF